MSSLVGSGIAASTEYGWASTPLALRGSWHGLSVQDLFLLIAGLIFTFVFVRLINGD
jgi:hypothetical protein